MDRRTATSQARVRTAPCRTMSPRPAAVGRSTARRPTSTTRDLSVTSQLPLADSRASPLTSCAFNSTRYRDGTIDTTRTLHYGSPTAEQKAAYTRVLQGHLAVIRTVFPEGRGGQDFNTLARAPLWQSRLDFGHGVGHGIGAYGGVHEGPEGIGAGNAYPLKASVPCAHANLKGIFTDTIPNHAT